MRVSHIVALAAATMAAPASAADIFHFDAGGSAFETVRGAGSAPSGRLTVDSAVTVVQIGIRVDLNGTSNMQFFIFDANSGSALYTSSIQSFLDDGLGYKWSNPLSFTFQTGTTYSVTATSSTGGQYSVDFVGNQVDVFNFLTGNQNTNGAFGSTTLNTAQACCDVATAFRTGAIAVVPEPSTWAILVLGMGAIGGAMRRRTKASLTYRPA